MNELDLFAAAIGIADAADREAFLSRECAGRSDLRRRLDALLDAHARSNPLLDHPSQVVSNETAAYAPASAVVGTTIAGRYKILQQIGEGGMGTVFMAEQDEPVRRKVAIKIIKPGMDSRQVVARFEAERQALAMMDHTNIARVLDGGATESGRPFFVMELVHGVPIIEFCDANKLTPRERLELFIPVCQAIQHAHQKGIIHRDIKPSNILVTMYDDKPVPKVIDFGVAKAIEQRLTEKTLFTQYGTLVGTFEYMSPEQAEMNAFGVDTRGDVYSLGVLMYELLTGTTPLERKRLREAGFGEVVRLIKEEEPPRPSDRISTSQVLAKVAEARKTEPAKLSSLVRGELDWIVMKCLEKDRARRYETANGLARDVQRYLAGDAVEACPPSATYRLRKFARKNRAALTTAAAIAALLVAGVGVSTWQAIRANRAARSERIARTDAEKQKAIALSAADREARERKEAEAARLAEAEQKKLAQAKEAEANAVIKYFEDQIFSTGRPLGQDGGLGRDVRLRESIEAGLPALDRAFPDQPLVEARLRNTLGLTYGYLGELARAAAQFVRARALFTRHRGPDHHDTLSSMNNLANCYSALGRQEEALTLREETLAAQKRVLPPDHPVTLRSMGGLANSYDVLGRHAEALKLREDALEAMKRVLPPDHADTLMSMNNLANSYDALGRHAEALKLYKEVLAARKRVLPSDHPDTLSSMNNLALCYAALGRQAEALKLREETLEARKRVLPPDHPDTLMSMNNLALSYAALGRHAEALKLHEESLAIMKRVLPPDHPDTIKSIGNLALSYDALGRHSEALKLREETLAAMKRVLPPDHPDTLLSMGNVVLSLVELDRGAEAIPIIDECVMKAAGKAVDPKLIPVVMDVRMRYFQKLADAAGCRATAVMWEKLNRTDADSLYNAACFRAVASAVQAKAGGPDAERLASNDADRAMVRLKKAIAAGYKDKANMENDTDLNALRDRDDFKKLLAEMK